jgi:hypothetical protein
MNDFNDESSYMTLQRVQIEQISRSFGIPQHRLFAAADDLIDHYRDEMRMIIDRYLIEIIEV